MKKLPLWIFLIFFVFIFVATEKTNRKSEICARNCYFRMVSRVSPINIFGLVSIFIYHPNPRHNLKRYFTEKEAFQNLCWTYRSTTKKCLQNCRNNALKRWLDKVFFTPLNKYCVEFYEDIILNWNCIRKLKKYRHLCDRECAGTCDKTCLYFCYRPVSRRICKTEIPAKILFEVSELKSPQQNGISRHQPICIKEEITNYSNVKTTVIQK